MSGRCAEDNYSALVSWRVVSRSFTSRRPGSVSRRSSVGTEMPSTSCGAVGSRSSASINGIQAGQPEPPCERGRSRAEPLARAEVDWRTRSPSANASWSALGDEVWAEADMAWKLAMDVCNALMRQTSPAFLHV